MRLSIAHSLSVWHDRRRRDRKLLRRARQADVAIVSAGKSGRTWVRTMLSHLYRQRYRLPPTELINFDNFHQCAPAIPRIFFAGLTADGRTPSGRTWGEEIGQASRLVLLERDPRDVAVSFYFQLSERAPPRALRRKGISAAEDIRRMPMLDFMLDARLGLPRLFRFGAAWRAVVRRHPLALELSYEALRSQPETSVAALARFVDPAAAWTDAEIAAAIGVTGFATMQAQERAGFFAGDRLRPGDAGNPESFKVRRGKIGGYRDYLSADAAAIVDALAARNGWPMPPLPTRYTTLTADTFLPLPAVDATAVAGAAMTDRQPAAP